jgi:PAS domain S-box-containing protein
LPATLAARVSFVLGLVLVALETATGALWTTELSLLYWSFVGLLAVLAFLPQIPERSRGMIVVGTWVSAGWFSLLVAGLREGFVILSTAVALTGGFLGLRGALVVIGASAAWGALVGWLHIGGLAASPPRYTASDQPHAWGLGIATFSGLSLMASIVQARLAAAVQASSARARAFAVVADRSTSAVIFTDLTRSIVWVNDAFVTLTGYTADEVRGRVPGEFLQGEGTPPEDRATMREALAAQRACRLDTVNYRKDGTPYWVRLDLQPFRDEQGVLRGFTSSQLDVTAERMSARLDEIERQLLADFAAGEVPLDEALVGALLRAEPVRYARVVLLAGDRLEVSAAAIAASDRLGAPVVPELPPAPPSLPDGEALLDVHDAPRSMRLFYKLGAAAPGFVEIGLAASMPGQSALSRRLPGLLALHGLFCRRQEDEAQIEDMFAYSPEALVVLGGQDQVLQRNAEAARLLPRLALGEPFGEAYPELRAALAPPLLPALGPTSSRPRRSVTGAHRRSAADLATVAPTWKVELTPGRVSEVEVGVNRRPGRAEMLVAVRDVTERMRQLETARFALHEKEILIKEIHHRVKNNLQIVSSLLDMQVDAAPDPASVPALRESVLRVRSMALVHQALYGNESLARLDFGQYVRDLVRAVQGTLRPDARVEVRSVPAEVGMDQAVPLGLILNELLTNSFKYGLGADPAARAIEVVWSVDAAGFRLAVIDQGPGLSAPPDAGTKSLGLRLVLALARQVGGAFAHRRTAEGSVFEVTGPAPVEIPRGRAGPTNSG